MTTLEIPDKSIHIEIPAHWDEMSPSQIHHALSWCMAAGAGQVSELHCRIMVFYKIGNIRRTWRSIAMERIMGEAWTIEKNSNIAMVARQCTGFLFDETNKTLEINYNTVLNHFASIGKKLHGPTHLLADITFGEFRAALEELDEYFTLRRDDADEKALQVQLCRFIACLYRPLVAGKREPFSRDRIETNAKKLRKVDPIIKVAVMLWFTHIIQYIQRNDLIISSRTINLSPLFPRPKNERKKPTDVAREGSAAAWTGVLYTVAKEGLFGEVDKTDKAGLFDILLYMYEQHQEARRMKARMKKK